jgi:hypothetical protein
MKYGLPKRHLISTGLQGCVSLSQKAVSSQAETRDIPGFKFDVDFLCLGPSSPGHLYRGVLLAIRRTPEHKDHSLSSVRLLACRHHNVVTYIVTSPSERYWILFSAVDGNQTLHSGNLVQHIGPTFRKVAYSSHDVPSTIIQTAGIAQSV